MAFHLTDEQIEKFNDEGFLVVPELLGDGDLSPVKTEYANLLDELARTLVAEGQIADYPELHRFSMSPYP